MKKLPGRKVINIQTPEALHKEFNDKIRFNGNTMRRDMSDTLRGMMMLYVSEVAFRNKVDRFVETTKTI